MPKLTKREAIRECKRFWGEVIKSGLSKYRFLLWTDSGKKWWDKGYNSECPLCQYVFGEPSDKECDTHCPLMLQYDMDCVELGYASDPKAFYEYVKGLKEVKVDAAETNKAN